MSSPRDQLEPEAQSMTDRELVENYVRNSPLQTLGQIVIAEEIIRRFEQTLDGEPPEELLERFSDESGPRTVIRGDNVYTVEVHKL